jgi:hypothetical protein
VLGCAALALKDGEVIASEFELRLGTGDVHFIGEATFES